MSYAYDVFGNLPSVAKAGGASWTYSIDPLKRRIAKDATSPFGTRWLYDGAQIVAEHSPFGTAYFVYGRFPPSPTTWFATGSPTSLIFPRFC